MVETTTDERVLLALADAPDDGYRSVVEIGEMLEMSAETMADRIALLSTLSGLEEEALVETSAGEADRTRYALTGAGRDRATAVRDRLADHPIEVKNGKTETVAMADLDRYLEPPAMARALARATANDVLYLEEGVEEEFVDREAEIDRLLGLYASVSDGAGRTVLVTGEAGIGKTTLVDALLEEVRNEATVLEGVCRQGAAEPYQPVRAALDPHVESSPFDRPELAVDDAEGLHAQRAALFADVADAVRKLADERPVVLFLDDLHAAAGPTVQLAGALVERLAAAPVLLVASARPGELSEELLGVIGVAGEEAPGERIDLAPFARGDTRRLVEWLVDSRRVPKSFVELVHDRTGGNPLFVTESVSRLVETGEVDPARGLYPEDPDRLPIPEGVESAIRRRIEALDDAGQAVLSTAALLGESFDYELLVAATDHDGEVVRGYVDLLVDAQVLEPVEGEADLRFVSGLVRETVVDRVPDDRRSKYHRRVAAGLTDVVGDDPERAGAVAFHYDRAGDTDRALDAWMEAAEHAESVYAPELALEAYEEALDLARATEDEARTLDVLEARGEVQLLQGELDAAERSFEYVHDEAPDPGRRQRAAEAICRVLAKNDPDRAIPLAEDAIGLVDADPGSPADCRLLVQKGRAHEVQGEFDRAREHFEVTRRARELYEEVGNRVGAMSTLYNLALTEGLQSLRGGGDVSVEEAMEMADSVLGEARALGHRRAITSGLLVKAVILWQGRYDIDAALEHMSEALELAERTDNARVQTASLHFMGTAHLQTGRDADEALAYAEEMLDYARETEMPVQQVWANTLIGDVHLATGDVDSALATHEQAVSVADGSDDPILEIDARTSLATAHLGNDDPGAAREQLDRAGALAADVDATQTLARPIRALRRPLLRIDGVRAQCDRAEGDLPGAIEGFEATLEAAKDNRDRIYEAELLAELGRTHRRAGDSGRSREHFRQALELAREIGVRGVAADCEAALGDLPAD